MAIRDWAHLQNDATYSWHMKPAAQMARRSEKPYTQKAAQAKTAYAKKPPVVSSTTGGKPSEGNCAEATETFALWRYCRLKLTGTMPNTWIA